MGEQERIEGGELLVDSSLVIGGKTGTDTESDPRKRRGREEESLEEFKGQTEHLGRSLRSKFREKRCCNARYVCVKQ